MTRAYLRGKRLRTPVLDSQCRLVYFRKKLEMFADQITEVIPDSTTSATADVAK